MSKEEVTASEVQDTAALLEAAKADSNRAQKELEEAQTNAAKLEEESRALQFKQQLQTALQESGLQFHCSVEEIQKLITAEPNLDVRPNGDAYYSGDRISLANALRLFGRRHPTFLQRSKEEITEQRTDTTIQAKSQLVGVNARVAFIAEHGLAAYEALPQNTPTEVMNLPSSQLVRLPFAERSRLVRQLGEDGWARLLRRNADKQ